MFELKALNPLIIELYSAQSAVPTKRDPLLAGSGIWIVDESKTAASSLSQDRKLDI